MSVEAPPAPVAPAPTRTAPPEQRRLVKSFLRLTLGPKRPDPARLLLFPPYLRQKLPAAFNALPPLQREVCFRQLSDAQPQAFIALLLGKSDRWVRLQMQAALDTLCAQLWTTRGTPRRLGSYRSRGAYFSSERKRAYKRATYRRQVEAAGRVVHPYRRRA